MNDTQVDIEVYKEAGELFLSYIVFDSYGEENINTHVWNTKRISEKQAMEIVKLLSSFN